MKKIVLFTLFATAAAAYGFACNGDNTQNDGGLDTGTDTCTTGCNGDAGKDTGSDAGFPAVPTLKTQIDRMGRPAINTALNHVFDPTAAAGTAKDAYNADKQVANWGVNYAAQFKANLAIFDALDTTADGGAGGLGLPGNGCGNQTAYTLGGKAPYTALAGLAADDQLYVNTASTTCTMYLAVELNATAIAANTDCGGRKMTYDVMNTTYAAVAGNPLAPVVPVTDGPTTAVPSKTNGTTFPYLAAPM